MYPQAQSNGARLSSKGHRTGGGQRLQCGETLAKDLEAHIQPAGSQTQEQGMERAYDLHPQRHPKLPGQEQSSLTQLSWHWAEVGPETTEVLTNLNSA